MSYNKVIENLYVGSWDSARRVKPDYHIHCAYEIEAPRKSPQTWIHLDDVETDWRNDRGWVRAVLGAVVLGAEKLDKGKRVLVTCHQGYNRSGLVAALILVTQGYEPQKAISLVRKARGSFALSNKSFREFVRFGGERMQRYELMS